MFSTCATNAKLWCARSVDDGHAAGGDDGIAPEITPITVGIDIDRYGWGEGVMFFFYLLFFGVR